MLGGTHETLLADGSKICNSFLALQVLLSGINYLAEALVLPLYVQYIQIQLYVYIFQEASIIVFPYRFSRGLTINCPSHIPFFTMTSIFILSYCFYFSFSLSLKNIYSFFPWKIPSQSLIYYFPDFSSVVIWIESHMQNLKSKHPHTREKCVLLWFMIAD